MAHFAKLDDNNVVIDVNAVHNNELLDNGVESEAKGVEFLTSRSNGHSNWKQTSYNASIRKNYAGVGYTYDATRDAFIPPKPLASWLLNKESCQWAPPIAYPTDGKIYCWDEASITWIINETEAG